MFWANRRNLNYHAEQISKGMKILVLEFLAGTQLCSPIGIQADLSDLPTQDQTNQTSRRRKLVSLVKFLYYYQPNTWWSAHWLVNRLNPLQMFRLWWRLTSFCNCWTRCSRKKNCNFWKKPKIWWLAEFFPSCSQHQQAVDLSGGMRELEIGYHQVQHDRDFTSQMPFTFRVQPNHPNLQEDE